MADIALSATSHALYTRLKFWLSPDVRTQWHMPYAIPGPDGRYYSNCMEGFQLHPNDPARWARDARLVIGQHRAEDIHITYNVSTENLTPRVNGALSESEQSDLSESSEDSVTSETMDSV
jgi:hypothetical protein